MGVDLGFIDYVRFKGYNPNPESRILDFGCGAGANVYKIIDAGYPHCEGYDVADRPLELRDPADRSKFYIDPDGHIPVPDSTYDFVFSSQVFEHVQDQRAAFQEILRVMKPGGVCINVFPANWRLIEPHIYVPLATRVLFRSRAWFWLWALLGVRNSYQQGLSKKEIVERNYEYMHTSVNYVSPRQYKKILADLPITWWWGEYEYNIAGGGRRAQLGKKFPIILTISKLVMGVGRAFGSRILVVRKNP